MGLLDWLTSDTPDFRWLLKYRRVQNPHFIDDRRFERLCRHVIPAVRIGDSPVVTMNSLLEDMYGSSVGYHRYPVVWDRQADTAVLKGHPYVELPKFQLSADMSSGGFMWVDLQRSEGVVGIVENPSRDKDMAADLVVASRHYASLDALPSLATKALHRWIAENRWTIPPACCRYIGPCEQGSGIDDSSPSGVSNRSGT